MSVTIEDLAANLNQLLTLLHDTEEKILAMPFEPVYDYQNKINTARLEIANILNAVDQFDMDMTGKNELMNHPALLMQLKELIDKTRQNVFSGNHENVFDDIEDFIDNPTIPDNYRAIAIEELGILRKKLG